LVGIDTVEYHRNESIEIAKQSLTPNEVLVAPVKHAIFKTEGLVKRTGRSDRSENRKRSSVLYRESVAVDVKSVRSYNKLRFLATSCEYIAVELDE
jgi:hypothetical protein